LIDPIRFAYFVVALLAALTVHEAAHALVANWLGDPTGRKLGRITLNPIAHLDPMGTMMIFMSSLLGVGIGWGKPVPVNPFNLRVGPKTGMALVAGAGPASNLLMAAVLALALQQDLGLPTWALRLLVVTISVNVVLAVFNMIPLPPLDGFRVLTGILPNGPAYLLGRVEQYGPALLLLLVFFGGSLLREYLSFFGVPILRALGVA
jgi:Zn-dependent protease